ncbi:hypothetical protein ACIQ69_19875 [Bacillus paramycoides]|uniref:hypothetical protein n=1 Tax=Bacillus paramycoides TaxID=2026194 RepID=UPI00381832C5
MSSKIEVHYKAKNGIELTYMEDPYPIQNFKGERKLLVIFQSLGNENSDDARHRYPYTLIDGLKFYNCRKIYIKDDIGHVGSYYLGLNGKFDVRDAVLEFLKLKINEYKILKEDIIFFGPSKGGYAALNFGYELGVKNILTAVPQYHLYNFIEQYKSFLTYILPETITEETKAFYNNYLGNVIKNSRYTPNIYLITSRHDNLYDDHILPLVEAINETGSNLFIYENNETYVTRHNNVVVNTMNEILAILSMLLCDDKIKTFFNPQLYNTQK